MPIALTKQGLELSGRVNIDTAPALKEALLTMLAQQPQGVAQVETRELSALDVAVIQLLYAAQEGCRKRGGALLFPAPSEALKEMNQRAGSVLVI